MRACGKSSVKMNFPAVQKKSHLHLFFCNNAGCQSQTNCIIYLNKSETVNHNVMLLPMGRKDVPINRGGTIAYTCDLWHVWEVCCNVKCGMIFKLYFSTQCEMTQCSQDQHLEQEDVDTLDNLEQGNH